MLFFSERPTKKPISDTWIIRTLVVLLILAALTAGYYANQVTGLRRQVRKLQSSETHLPAVITHSVLITPAVIPYGHSAKPIKDRLCKKYS